MNNVVGNIMLSQEDDDKHTRAVCRATIENREKELAKIPRAKHTEARRAKLEAELDGAKRQLAALDEARPEQPRRRRRDRDEVTKDEGGKDGTSYVAAGTAGTWDGREETAKNPPSDVPGGEPPATNPETK